MKRLVEDRNDLIWLQNHAAACDRPVGRCIPCQLWYGMHPIPPEEGDPA